MCAPGQLGDRDVLRVTRPAQVDAVVLEALAREPLADAELVHQVDGVLLEQTGADPALDVVAAAVLDDHALDPVAREQQREHQPSGTGADDPDLGSHVRRSPIGRTGSVSPNLPARATGAVSERIREPAAPTGSSEIATGSTRPRGNPRTATMNVATITAAMM